MLQLSQHTAFTTLLAVLLYVLNVFSQAILTALSIVAPQKAATACSTRPLPIHRMLLLFESDLSFFDSRETQRNRLHELLHALLHLWPIV